MINSDPIQYVNENAENLIQQYDSVGFEDVHPELIEYFSSPPGKILDIGAGSGRDAAWLQKVGYEVIAVEPSEEMRIAGQRKNQNVIWIDDKLPHLKKISADNGAFDAILISGVFMFLDKCDQQNSLKRLKQLLKTGGRMFLLVRFGSAEPERGLYDIDKKDLLNLIASEGFKVLEENHAEDQFQRENVNWYSLTLGV